MIETTGIHQLFLEIDDQAGGCDGVRETKSIVVIGQSGLGAPARLTRQAINGDELIFLVLEIKTLLVIKRDLVRKHTTAFSVWVPPFYPGAGHVEATLRCRELSAGGGEG